MKSSSLQKATIVWFRQDLRLKNNPALDAALAKGGSIVPLYIWSPEEEGNWPLGGAARWWLHRSLESLKASLPSLIIRQGHSLDILQQVAKETNADTLFWNRRYEPTTIARDSKLKAALTEEGMLAVSFNGSLLFEPWEILNKSNKPFQVFTPFWKACLLKLRPPAAPPAPAAHLFYVKDLKSLTPDNLDLLPAVDWAQGLKTQWLPGEAGAAKALKAFLSKVDAYPSTRDRPDLEGVSRLSPYLHFGEISPKAVWQAVASSETPNKELFLRQLGWREFAYHLLYHFPHTPEEPLRDSFSAFPWQSNLRHLNAWRRGKTGYPIVDAGMRQLWNTGWMHNRVRMIVGSFLVKDLLISWSEGARWFWDTLVDADLANNTLGWQWVGGCGADAAPYFRVFNPVTQGEKFDPDGTYVRRFVPELKELPAKWIHKPWQAPPHVLEDAGVVLGDNYPTPIVDHANARAKALETFSLVRSKDDL